MFFTYRGIDGSGQLVSDTIEVESRYVALERLKDRGLTVIDMKEQVEESYPDTRRVRLEIFGVSRTQVAFFTRHLCQLLETGIPLVESLFSLRCLTPNRRFSKIIAYVAGDVQKGSTLSAAMAHHPQAFDGLYISMVKVGESSGSLIKMLDELAGYLERDMELRSKLRAALAYPTFVLLFSCALFYAMINYLLPAFEPMWNASGVNLQDYPLTVALMQVSRMAHNVWDEVLLGGLVTLSVLLFILYKRTRQGALLVDGLLLRLPVIGNFVSLTSTSRALSTLGTMLDSGASLLLALEMTASVSDNQVVAAALRDVSVQVAQGTRLSTALKGYQKVFPGLMIQMLSLGEQSGDLGRMVPRVAGYYRSQLDAELRSFAALAEPLMMVLVGVVVGLFVLGVMMPIIGIVGALETRM